MPLTPFQKLFRKGTPHKVLQTVDVGSRNAEYILKQARKFKGRKYAVVEPLYATQPERFSEVIGNLRQAGVMVVEGTVLDMIEKDMKPHGLKTRHFNIDMPDPIEFFGDSYNYPEFFRRAREVLFPNGDIFITSESLENLRIISKIARNAGFSVAKPKEVFSDPRSRRTEDMKVRKHAKSDPVYRLVIVNSKP